MLKNISWRKWQWWLEKDLSDAQGTLSKMDALLNQYTDPSTPTVKMLKTSKS